MARYSLHSEIGTQRLRTVGVCWLLVTGLFIVRLLYLETVQHARYTSQASGARTLHQSIRAKRGEIFAHDARAGQETLYPIAINQDKFLLVSDNRKVKDTVHAAHVIASSSGIEGVDEVVLLQKLSVAGRAYQPLLKDVRVENMESMTAQMERENVAGLYFDREPARFYPERELLAHISGFIGKDTAGAAVGRYGVEGYFDEQLRGVDGFVRTEKDPFGGWIPVADREFKAATDGSDLIVTVDRVIQLRLCDALAQGVKKYEARSGSGIIMDPHTGAILAMCNVPTFDPNEYQKVGDPSVYNNDALFRAFEPGSVFKAFTMSAALDAGVVSPDTTYVDAGFVKRDGFTIRNAANKIWGTETMTNVIKESINTGTVFAADLLGIDRFKTYVENFGFGAKTGVELKTEEKGIIKSLRKKGSVYIATASFGQGITVTPMQLIQGYGAIANKGVMMKPYITYAWRDAAAQVTVTKPTEIRRVISEKAAAQITEMMRAVVDEAHGKLARVPGYSIAGKTGTAQIVGNKGKYEDASINNHTFVGYGPIANPRFVMLITYEAPHARFAESTAVPTFGEVAKFLLEYLGVSQDRPLAQK